MSEQAKSKFHIPPAVCRGLHIAGAVLAAIQPNSTLIFDVQLIKVESKQ